MQSYLDSTTSNLQFPIQTLSCFCMFTLQKLDAMIDKSYQLTEQNTCAHLTLQKKKLETNECALIPT